MPTRSDGVGARVPRGPSTVTTLDLIWTLTETKSAMNIVGGCVAAQSIRRSSTIVRNRQRFLGMYVPHLCLVLKR